MPVFRIDTDFGPKFKGLAQAIAREADSAVLKADLAKRLRAALAPSVQQAKARVLGMRSAGLTKGPSIRKAVARQVRAEARITKVVAGARVRVSKSGLPRDFDNAPKRLNSRKGWRHPTFGRRENSKDWVTQKGAPEWLDKPMRENRPQATRAIEKVLQDMAERIAARVKRV